VLLKLGGQNQSKDVTKQSHIEEIKNMNVETFELDRKYGVPCPFSSMNRTLILDILLAGSFEYANEKW